MIKIAVDAMGGDHAPEEVIYGSLLALKEHSDLEIQLYGDEELIRQYLPEMPKRLQVIATTQVIATEEEPVKAIRQKKDSSMVQAAQAVKEGRADALFSAGNTGALLAAGLLIVGRVKGIDRPGLMPVFPVVGTDRQFVFLDVGANADCKPKNLVQFAILGQYYAREVLGIEAPKIALLNNGAEAGKGSELTKEVYKRLAQDESLNFIGNLESRYLLEGQADVVVTDGFTGNAVLKTIEGTGLTLMRLVKETILSGGLGGKMGGVLLKNSLKDLKGTLNVDAIGGAVLFGLKAAVVKVHGSSERQSISKGIQEAYQIHQSGVIAHLSAHFNALAEQAKKEDQ